MTVHATDATKCSACISTHYVTSDGLACKTKISNCTTHTSVVSTGGASTFTCDTCATNWVKQTDGLACKDCSSLTHCTATEYDGTSAC